MLPYIIGIILAFIGFLAYVFKRHRPIFGAALILCAWLAWICILIGGVIVGIHFAIKHW